MGNLENWLTENGFERECNRDGDTEKLTLEGTARVILPRSECPWVTFQRLNSREVDWYVDFAADTPQHAIIAFIGSMVGAKREHAA